jgi:hypothetical protein
MRVLLDNLGHTRRLWTKGNRNARHGLGEILDHTKNTLRIPWNGGNLLGTGFLEERGWIPLEICKQMWEEPQIAMESPSCAGRRS